MRSARVMSAALIAAGASVLLSSCAPAITDDFGLSTPTPTAAVSSDTSPMTPEEEAQRLLASIQLPPGATPATSAKGVAGLDKPFQQIACTPIIDESKFADVPGTDPAALRQWLQKHPSTGFRAQGWTAPQPGSMSPPIWGTFATMAGPVAGITPLMTFAQDHGNVAVPELLYAEAAAPGGGSVLRIDIQVIPPDASCVHIGGIPLPPAL